MTYTVKEIFPTLQGEGAQSGMPAVFCRFAGCNLWNGRERDRDRAVCRFCDTDFVGTDGSGGGRFATADELADAVQSHWPSTQSSGRLVVLTGGEPALQVDAALLQALHARSFRVAIETNGTLALPPGIDWVCVSPKADSEVVVQSGQELKLVFPQPGVDPQRFAAWAFDHHFLQPMDGPDRQANTDAAIRYCLEHPQWRLGVQTHKLIGIR